MESILKSDIFFFITSISVVVIASLLVVALFYLIKILRNFHKISKILRNYAETTESGLRDLGEQIRRSPLFTFIFGKEKTKREEDSHAKKI
ncbi:MAG: hypothetical protein EOM85_02660 [Candidatus Moranbacteria bacterium]|nr:hypothetical protein [Candidatus Moranbacteria bacterium]